MKGETEDGRREETGSTAACSLARFIHILLSSSSALLLLPRSVLVKSTVAAVTRVLRFAFALAQHRFSLYIFIVIITVSLFSSLSSYVKRPSNVSVALLVEVASTSAFSPLPSTRSQRTIERRYHNARQRVINNSAGGFSSHAEHDIRNISCDGARDYARRTARIIPTLHRSPRGVSSFVHNSEFFREAFKAPRTGRHGRHASFNSRSIVGSASLPIYPLPPSCNYKISPILSLSPCLIMSGRRNEKGESLVPGAPFISHFLFLLSFVRAKAKSFFCDSTMRMIYLESFRDEVKCVHESLCVCVCA